MYGQEWVRRVPQIPAPRSFFPPAKNRQLLSLAAGFPLEDDSFPGIPPDFGQYGDAWRMEEYYRKYLVRDPFSRLPSLLQ